MAILMDDVIQQYRKWKEQGEGLRGKARQAMEARFAELLVEAVRISEDYKRDFGAVLKPPAVVTAFRFKAGAKAKPKKKAAAPAPAPVAVTAVPDDPKTAALAKKLAAAKKKLEAAKAAGQATRALEDKVYEIEDDLRLASQAG